mgnify:CR=1 FL=1
MKKAKDTLWSIWIIVLVLIAIVTGMHKHITSFVNLPDNVDRIVWMVAIVGIVVPEIILIISRICCFVKEIKSKKE